jgi:translation initiation factor 3 subunit K
MLPSSIRLINIVEVELEDYIARLGWKFDSSAGVVEVPPNPDNQIASTVVQEDIKLQRMFRLVIPECLTHF